MKRVVVMALDRNITGVDWEAETEIQRPASHMLQLNNNQYVALADKEDNEGKDNESTGVQNDGEITGVRHNDKIIGVNSDNETPELVSMEANYKADELALI